MFDAPSATIEQLAAPLPQHKPKGPERNHTRALTDGEVRRLLAFVQDERRYKKYGSDVTHRVEIMLLTGGAADRRGARAAPIGAAAPNTESLRARTW